MRFGLLFFAALGLHAQLVLSGPVPKTSNPPVVFLNGYQSPCGGDFASTFVAADKVLQANGTVSVFFDNCSVPDKPSIEALGAAFGKFLSALKYTDGTAVTQVDIIAHSMGGLIVRSYLAGKQDTTPATFIPPATTPIRKIIFIATPQFGTTTAAFGSDKQSAELAPASQFLFDLNTWNQGTDDLRGIPAATIVGSGGTGNESGFPGFDDGVATLTSAGLGFYRTSVTRIVPYCHTQSSLLTLAGFCASGTPTLTNINTDPNNPVSQFILSYLNGTNAWQSIGQAPEQNSQVQGAAGIELQLRDKDDNVQQISSAVVAALPRNIILSTNANLTAAFSEALDASVPTMVTATSDKGISQTATYTLPRTTEAAVILKPGPVISPKGVIPAVTQPPFPFDVAPGAFVAIYGSNLASTAKALPQPYPTTVDDLQVLVNGAPVPIQFAGPTQINIVYPDNASGLTQLTVKNNAGRETINIRVAAAVPSIFEIGNGAAAATNGKGIVVGSGNPLHAGDVLVLYLTGLGATDKRQGLDYASVQPTVTVGGKDCPVGYAGRTPGVAALDQINCTVPAGVTGNAVPVIVTSASRQSATTTLNVQ